MSGLAGILAGHRPAGLGRWHSHEAVPDVRHAVEVAGWHFAYVDGWTHQDKPAVLAALGEALAFGDHYGQNLDALVDCLRDITERTMLLWDGWGPLAREDAPTFTALREILGERTGSEPALAVLLRGDGPDLDVPWID